MKIPKELTTVTLLSKCLALVVFLVVPIIAFGLGVQYQQGVDLLNQQAALQIQTPQAIPTPTPNEASPSAETANWKTYTNKAYGYSFKYPSTLLEIDGSLFTTRPISMPSSTAVLALYTMKKSLYSEYFIDFNAPVGTKKEWQEKGEIQTLVERFVLDNKRAIKVRSEKFGNQSSAESGVFILVDLGNDVLSIFQSDSMLQRLDKYEVALDQILSTFKFTQ